MNGLILFGIACLVAGLVILELEKRSVCGVALLVSAPSKSDTLEELTLQALILAR